MQLQNSQLSQYTNNLGCLVTLEFKIIPRCGSGIIWNPRFTKQLNNLRVDTTLYM